MTTLVNTNPYGAIDLVHVGLSSHIEYGEAFDVPADVAVGLLSQVGNYAVVDASELDGFSAEVVHALAAERGIEAKNKAAAIEALSGVLVHTPDHDA